VELRKQEKKHKKEDRLFEVELRKRECEDFPEEMQKRRKEIKDMRDIVISKITRHGLNMRALRGMVMMMTSIQDSSKQ
jgi:hypothetical protein